MAAVHLVWGDHPSKGAAVLVPQGRAASKEVADPALTVHRRRREQHQRQAQNQRRSLLIHLRHLGRRLRHRPRPKEALPPPPSNALDVAGAAAGKPNPPNLPVDAGAAGVAPKADATPKVLAPPLPPPPKALSPPLEPHPNSLDVAGAAAGVPKLGPAEVPAASLRSLRFRALSWFFF